MERRYHEKRRHRMEPIDTSKAEELKEHLQRQLLNRRRAFLKRALLVTAYAAPLVTSFAAGDLARAASCPGVGRCGKSDWAHSM